MDDNVYYLVPKSDMQKYNVSTPVNVGGADPMPVYSTVEAPKDTNHYRTSKLTDKIHSSLESQASPESILKIYNFLTGLYRTSVHLDKTSSDDKNKSKESVREADIDYTIFTQSLPTVASKLAPGLIDYLKTNTSLVFDPSGFVTNQNKDVRVHIIDLMRTLLVNKTKISTEINSIIQSFIRDLPKSFLKNKSVKIEGEAEEQWDAMQ